MPRNAGSRTASVRMREVIVNTCEADWTGVDAACVVSDATETTYFKRGTRSVYIEIAAACVQGIQAYGASASAALDLRAYPTGVGYTHIKYWIRSSAAHTAGQVKIGMSNAADDSGTEYYVNIPALAANTWTLVRTALSADMITNLSSMDTIHIYLQDAAFEGILYLDDIRICRYLFGGSTSSEITLPSTQTLGNTNLDLLSPELFYLPWRSYAITVHELPVDVYMQGYLGPSAATWASTDLELGDEPLYTGQTAADLHREMTSVAFAMQSDLGAGAELSFLVTE